MHNIIYLLYKFVYIFVVILAYMIVVVSSTI